MEPLSNKQRDRYSRHISLPEIGEAGQRKLLDSRVLIVGAGGLGGTIAYYLAAAGVGKIGLVDGDKVELSNLQRQILYTEADQDRPKTEAARQRLLELNSELEVEAHQLDLTEANADEIIATGNYQLVVDAVDNFAARRLLNRVALNHRVPFVHGAVYRFEGEAATFLPETGPCYCCLFGTEQTAVENPGPAAVAPGVIATIEASEALKYLLKKGDLLVGNLLRVDLLKMSFTRLTVQADPECPVCGDL